MLGAANQKLIVANKSGDDAARAFVAKALNRRDPERQTQLVEASQIKPNISPEKLGTVSGRFVTLTVRLLDPPGK